MTFRLADHGRAFATRPRGAELLHKLEGEARPGDLVVVDFAGVLSVSYSFADEFVGELLERQAAGRLAFTVRIANVARPLQRVVVRCLESRGVDDAVLDGLVAA